MIWSRAAKIAFAIGVSLWLAAIGLTPGELSAARKRAPIHARTVATFGCYLAAAILVLAGLPRRESPPPLPRR